MHTGLIRRAAAAVLCALFVLPVWAGQHRHWRAGGGKSGADHLSRDVRGRAHGRCGSGWGERTLSRNHPAVQRNPGSQRGRRFVYTPSEGKRGRDYFGYKAVDASGNLSQEATVILHIKKRPALRGIRRHSPGCPGTTPPACWPRRGCLPAPAWPGIIFSSRIALSARENFSRCA